MLDAPIIELDTIDSTNNYAMRLIDADTAHAGLTILARQQTRGKGQRERIWVDSPGESLLASFVCTPDCSVDEQPIFNAASAVAVADVLAHLYEGWDIRIKWPNDIILNDKKAGGILIENVLRGNGWIYSIVGLGLNVLQGSFPTDLPNATSLWCASGKHFSLSAVFDAIRKELLKRTHQPLNGNEVITEYNNYLFKRDQWQLFSDGVGEWTAYILKVESNGQLQVRESNGEISSYSHGTVLWKW